MDDGKKKLVAYVVIALCLAGAGLSYYLLSDNAPKQTPQLKAAESKSDTLAKTIAEEQAKQPPPPEVPPRPEGARRGSMAPPK